MKLYSLYTDSHRRLLECWMLPTLQDDYEIKLRHVRNENGSGKYLDRDWQQGVLAKSEVILSAVDECWGDTFIYSDCDVQFFSSTADELKSAISLKDIVLQCDNPFGYACTGFFIARGNQAVKDLWTLTREALLREGRDQIAFNKIIREMSSSISWGFLSQNFFSAGCGIRVPSWLARKVRAALGCEPIPHWEPGMPLLVPPRIIMHHANWTIGIENKIKQLELVRDRVLLGNHDERSTPS